VSPQFLARDMLFRTCRVSDTRQPDELALAIDVEEIGPGSGS